MSAIAIVFSLLYVGFELNRTTDVLDADRTRDTLEAMRSWEQLIIADEDLAAMYTRGPTDYEEFSETGQFRYRFLVVQCVAIWEQTFDSHTAGLLQTDNWESWNRSFRPELHHVQPLWPEIAVYFSDDFQRHIEDEMAKYLRTSFEVGNSVGRGED